MLQIIRAQTEKFLNEFFYIISINYNDGNVYDYSSDRRSN